MTSLRTSAWEAMPCLDRTLMQLSSSERLGETQAIVNKMNYASGLYYDKKPFN